MYAKKVSESEKVIQDYHLLLSQLGINFRIEEPWLVVGETKRVQGWKLHLSSIPVEAANLILVVAPVLKQEKITFKLAKNQIVLTQLNAGYLGKTQVGKFITIYPESDFQARHIAEILVKLTQGFSGPVISTDLRLGDIVYTRYGGFKSILLSDRLGFTYPSIYGLDGSLQPDNYTVPFQAPAFIFNPFEDFPIAINQDSNLVFSPGSQSVVFGPGYLFLELVKQDSKGAVLRVLDVRIQEQISVKIPQKGRKHCLSDQYGRDIRTRLKHQEFLHNHLWGFVPIPKVDPYFEVDGDGYLPLEYIEGQSLESFIAHLFCNRSWNSLSTTEKFKLFSCLEKLIIAVERLHAAGYVHRDLTTGNIWIGADEQVYLLDLELTHAVDDISPAFVVGTPGFMSPQQEAFMPPAFTDDIYALGCVMITFLTGLPPHLFLFIGEGQIANRLLELVNGDLKELIDIIARCVKFNPQERPDLLTIKAALRNSKSDLLCQGEIISNFPKGQFLHNLILKAQQGLLNDAIAEPKTGLWLSSSVSNVSHSDINVSQFYELRRSTNIGVAGVVYLLSRLARFGYATAATRFRIQTALQWLLANDEAPDKQLPGLHFGEAGVAVALAEAIASGSIERNPQIDAFLFQALSGKLDWHDITHGAAGQGIAVLYCSDRLQESAFLQLAHRCADYLIETQKQDGSWQVPPGVDNMSGQTLTGFAHGVSGIVYFLAEYARRFGSQPAEQAWQAGANWLFEQAILTADQQGLEWYYSDVRQETWQWWCHGSPGIALTFLRLYELTQNETYAQIATHALQTHPIDIRYRNLSQCHGLSGLGEIYLEAARVLGEEKWLERANNIAHTLFNLRRETNTGSVTWLVENLHQPTADLMVGVSGIIHFFLRLYFQGENISFPLLLDPL